MKVGARNVQGHRRCCNTNTYNICFQYKYKGVITIYIFKPIVLYGSEDKLKTFEREILRMMAQTM
jgi:hypothetical protein